MDLREYFFRTRVSRIDFARKIGCSRNYLGQITIGNARCGKHLAKIIELVTEGVVTAEEVLRTYDENPGKKR